MELKAKQLAMCHVTKTKAGWLVTRIDGNTVNESAALTETQARYVESLGGTYCGPLAFFFADAEKFSSQ